MPIASFPRASPPDRAFVCEVKGELIASYKMFEDTAALQDAFLYSFEKGRPCIGQSIVLRCRPDGSRLRWRATIPPLQRV
jgi:hypothetical protein